MGGIKVDSHVYMAMLRDFPLIVLLFELVVESMVVEMVSLKGGIGSIVHPPGSARTISGIEVV